MCAEGHLAARGHRGIPTGRGPRKPSGWVLESTRVRNSRGEDQWYYSKGKPGTPSRRRDLCLLNSAMDAASPASPSRRTHCEDSSDLSLKSSPLLIKFPTASKWEVYLEVTAPLFTEQRKTSVSTIFLHLSLKEVGSKGSLLAYDAHTPWLPTPVLGMGLYLTGSFCASVMIFKAHSLEYVQIHPKACMQAEWELKNNFLRWCPPNQNLGTKSCCFYQRALK